jgi:hypothetical protein
MKRILSLAVTALLLLSLLGAAAFAYDPVKYDIPKAVTPPVVDGAAGDGEWDNALAVEMMPLADLNYVADANNALGEGSVFRFMWDESNLYFLISVADKSVPDSAPPYGDALNSGDGVQFGVFGPTGGEAGVGETHLFFTMHPKTDNGSPDIYEHFNIVDQIANETHGAKIASTFQNDSAYTVEGYIPWSVFATVYKNGFTDEIKGVSGQQLRISCVVMEMNGGEQSLITKGGWFDFDETDTYTLTDAPAGFVPAPETEAPVEEAPAPVAEEAPAAAAAPAAATPAAQTGDTAAIIVLLASAAAVIGAAVIKKRR